MQYWLTGDVFVTFCFLTLKTSSCVTDRNKPDDRVPTINRLKLVSQPERQPFGLLTLPLEKTLLHRKTDEIVLPATGSIIDPIRDIQNLLVFRQKSYNPALRARPSDYLFVTSRGKPVDLQIFGLILDHVCTITGLDRSPHSLRIGGATSLIQRGIPDVIVQLLGRWNSDAYRSYIRLDKCFLADYSAKMS